MNLLCKSKTHDWLILKGVLLMDINPTICKKMIIHYTQERRYRARARCLDPFCKHVAKPH